MTAVRDVRLIDVTLRDAHQCLWATRMTTAMMRPMSSALDDAGFEAIDLVGGAVFDVCFIYNFKIFFTKSDDYNLWLSTLHNRNVYF